MTTFIESDSFQKTFLIAHTNEQYSSNCPTLDINPRSNNNSFVKTSVFRTLKTSNTHIFPSRVMLCCCSTSTKTRPTLPKSAFCAFVSPTVTNFNNIISNSAHKTSFLTPTPVLSTPSLRPKHTRGHIPSRSRKTVSSFPTMTIRPCITLGDVPTNIGKLVSKLSSDAIETRGRFSVGISGGSLPKQLAKGLESSLDSLDFDKWDVFLADERIVPSDHPDSNHHEIASRFPSMPIKPIDHTLSPESCAQQYQKTICDALGNSPIFDVILLGLGPDGHTCSLFPGHSLVRLNLLPPVFGPRRFFFAFHHSILPHFIIHDLTNIRHSHPVSIAF